MTIQHTASELSLLIQDATNTRPVAEFITYIKQQLEISTTSWKLIADALAEASEMYGVDSDSYRRLLKATNFSKSKASKLVTIATSKRLKKHENQLRCVQSWSTLYEVTTLDDAQFAALSAEYELADTDSCPVLTESKVSAFKRVKAEKSAYKRIAFICVDEDALKGGLVNGSEYEALTDTLKQLSEISPYFKIVESDIFDNDSSLYQKKLSMKVTALTHKKLNECIKRVFDGRTGKRKNESLDKYLQRAFGVSREELHNSVNENDAKSVFSLFGLEDEYDLGKLYETAVIELSNANEKFAVRAIARANTAEPRII